MSGQESDLGREGPLSPLRLPLRLRWTDQDVAQLEGAVRLALERRRGGRPLRTAAEGLPEREHVGRTVLSPVPAVELAHRRIVDEREGELRFARDAVRAKRGADGAARRREVTRSLASDRDLQRSDAAWSVAEGIRAIRSSGYGMRSW